MRPQASTPSQPVTARFMRYGVEQEAKFTTVADALRFLADETWEGTLALQEPAVVDHTGNALAGKDDVMRVAVEWAAPAPEGEA